MTAWSCLIQSEMVALLGSTLSTLTGSSSLASHAYEAAFKSASRCASKVEILGIEPETSCLHQWISLPSIERTMLGISRYDLLCYHRLISFAWFSLLSKIIYCHWYPLHFIGHWSHITGAYFAFPVHKKMFLDNFNMSPEESSAPEWERDTQRETVCTEKEIQRNSTNLRVTWSHWRSTGYLFAWLLWTGHMEELHKQSCSHFPWHPEDLSSTTPSPWSFQNELIGLR